MRARLFVRARLCFPGEQLSGPWAVMTEGGPSPARRSSLLTERGGEPDSTRGGRLASGGGGGEPAQRQLNGEALSPALRRMTHLKRELAGDDPAG